MATFTLYLPDKLLAELDEARGSQSRSLVIRGALEGQMLATGVPGEAVRLPPDAPMMRYDDIGEHEKVAAEYRQYSDPASIPGVTKGVRNACPACEGEGYVDEEPCRECGGSGRTK
jgi:hypothetical protein